MESPGCGDYNNNKRSNSSAAVIQQTIFKKNLNRRNNNLGTKSMASVANESNSPDDALGVARDHSSKRIIPSNSPGPGTYNLDLKERVKQLSD